VTNSGPKNNMLLKSAFHSLLLKSAAETGCDIFYVRGNPGE